MYSDMVMGEWMEVVGKTTDVMVTALIAIWLLVVQLGREMVILCIFLPQKSY